ncbi:type I secretion system permease/ATPase [Aquabacterium sp.]|uniref:type I secretion system permease/ATPase n=1 Tax=Aquabacterium sp. TaxID=1872578 RepID=UPI0035B0AA0A
MKPQEQSGSELSVALGQLYPVLRKATGFSIVSCLLALVPTIYMFQVYDRVVNSRDHLTLLMLTIFLIGALMLMEVLETVRGHLLGAASRQFDASLNRRVFSVIHEAQWRRVSAGGAQAMNDLRTVRDFLTTPIVAALMEAPLALFYLLLLFLLSWVTGALALALAACMTVVTWLNERSTAKPLIDANRAATQAQQSVETTLRQAQVIESMGMLPAVFQRWQLQQNQVLRLQAQASDRAGVYQSLSRFIQTVMSSALLGMGAWLTMQGQLAGGAGSIIVGSVLGGKVVAPLVLLLTQWKTVVATRDAWGRLDKLLGAMPAQPPAMPLPAPSGRLTVDQLSAVAPRSQHAILKGVSFALQPGEVLAVIGPSASGKTTLARQLVGVWPVATGKVRLDGVDVHTWNKAELGPWLGFLPQNVLLLDGTLAENIARFGEVDIDKVREAATAVGLADYIDSLPQRYDTPVGRDGELLSGGLRQRVALARALYGQPVLVVLDEPNASLDEAGDFALAEAIRLRKASGTTFVVMTHRTSILGVTDKLLMLRDGVQQAFGPRDEVMAAVTRPAQAPTTARPAGVRA